MRRGLEIEERNLGGGWVEAYYLRSDVSGCMAIQEGLPRARGRLYELAAHGLRRIPLSRQLRLARPYKNTHFLLHVPRNHLEANPLVVEAVAEVLEGMEPEWASTVQRGCVSEDDPDAGAFWTRVPIEAVLAVMGDRRTRL